VNQTPTRSGKERLLRFFGIVVVSIAGAAVLTFGLDWSVLRVREATNRNPYGSVVVNHYTAVLQKNGKTTMTFDPPQPWTCVNSLFPHQGYLPCWYLRKHTDQRTDI
jgi:hypothetical protein